MRQSFLKGAKTMAIKTYELILDTETKHTSLQVKDSFSYGSEYFTTPMSVFTLMTEVFHLDTKADEYVYLGAFDNKMKLMGIFEVSHGTGNASLLDPRGVYMRALQIGASHIMLIHNHPSGMPLPSREDFGICVRMKKVGELVGIPLVDFIIIGNNDFTSFQEKELL